MGVRVAGAEDSSETQERLRRRCRIVSRAIRFACWVLAVLCLCCFAALIFLFFEHPLPCKGILLFLEWLIVCSVYLLISKDLYALFQKGSVDGSAILRRDCVSLLKRVSIWFLVLFVAAAVFSFVAAYIANGVVPSLSLSLPLAGFPTPVQWDVAFGADPPELQEIFTLDVSYLFIALITWSLSVVLEYGIELQEDKDSVV